MTVNGRMMPAQIWLVGGTTESVELASILENSGIPCVVTVLSSWAVNLYPQSSGITVCMGELTGQTLHHFCQEHHIGAILDASHPHATEISKLAMLASTWMQIPYLRFERSVVPAATTAQPPHVSEVETIEQILQGQYLEQQRVLLTIGSKRLHLFQKCQFNSTLFARILPRLQAFKAAEEAGFSCDRIIALRPPISYELEKALWQQWQISLVVTKASGQPGGEDIKRRVAQALGVSLIIIQRPLLTYPQQTSDVNTAIQFCQRALNHAPT